jgi:hypothetical protein
MLADICFRKLHFTAVSDRNGGLYIGQEIIGGYYIYLTHLIRLSVKIPLLTALQGYDHYLYSPRSHRGIQLHTGLLSNIASSLITNATTLLETENARIYYIGE